MVQSSSLFAGETQRAESGHSTRLLDVAKLVLSLTESAAEVIPIAGSPIKAAIGGVLKVLELFDVSDDDTIQRFQLIKTPGQRQKQEASFPPR